MIMSSLVQLLNTLWGRDNRNWRVWVSPSVAGNCRHSNLSSESPGVLVLAKNRTTIDGIAWKCFSSQLLMISSVKFARDRRICGEISLVRNFLLELLRWTEQSAISLWKIDFWWDSPRNWLFWQPLIDWIGPETVLRLKFAKRKFNALEKAFRTLFTPWQIILLWPEYPYM